MHGVQIQCNYKLIASGHREHKHMMAAGMCACLRTQMSKPFLNSNSGSASPPPPPPTFGAVHAGITGHILVPGRDSRLVQTQHSFYKSNRRSTKRRRETDKTEQTGVSETRTAWQKETGAERRVQQCVGNAAIIIQMWCKFHTYNWFHILLEMGLWIKAGTIWGKAISEKHRERMKWGQSKQS